MGRGRIQHPRPERCGYVSGGGALGHLRRLSEEDRRQCVLFQRSGVRRLRPDFNRRWIDMDAAGTIYDHYGIEIDESGSVYDPQGVFELE